MAKCAVIELSKGIEPTGAAVTRFRGEPSWRGEPQWPLSRSTGVPMGFLGQIVLTDVPGLTEEASTNGRIAYIFMTENENSVEPTGEPEGGRECCDHPAGR